MSFMALPWLLAGSMHHNPKNPLSIPRLDDRCRCGVARHKCVPRSLSLCVSPQSVLALYICIQKHKSLCVYDAKRFFFFFIFYFISRTKFYLPPNGETSSCGDVLSTRSVADLGCVYIRVWPIRCPSALKRRRDRTCSIHSLLCVSQLRLSFYLSNYRLIGPFHGLFKLNCDSLIERERGHLLLSKGFFFSERDYSFWGGKIPFSSKTYRDSLQRDQAARHAPPIYRVSEHNAVSRCFHCNNYLYYSFLQISTEL